MTQLETYQRKKRQALSDLKVLEYGHHISGPYCAKLMADMGAQVIKVEEPGMGDETRRMGPFLHDNPHPERSALFLYLNTNKLGITLKVDNARGKNIFKELIKQADILIENNPLAKMRELGLDYETLKQVNPRLIMTSITPFGQTGPYRDYKAHDLINFHMSGLGYVTPPGVEHPPSQPPLKAGGRQSDFVAGLTGATATLCALFQRRITGVGQQVDVSQQEALTSLASLIMGLYAYEKTPHLRTGHVLAGAIAILPCKNGYATIEPVGPMHWERLMEVMGNPQWAEDERFKEMAPRRKNWDAVISLLAEWTKQHTKEEFTRTAQMKRTPVISVNMPSDVVNSNQWASRGFFVDIDHLVAGTVKYPGAPFKLSQTPWRVDRPAPLLGQHNEEVLCQQLGYSREDLVKMAQAGVI